MLSAKRKERKFFLPSSNSSTNAFWKTVSLLFVRWSPESQHEAGGSHISKHWCQEQERLVPAGRQNRFYHVEDVELNTARCYRTSSPTTWCLPLLSLVCSEMEPSSCLPGYSTLSNNWKRTMSGFTRSTPLVTVPARTSTLSFDGLQLVVMVWSTLATKLSMASAGLFALLAPTISTVSPDSFFVHSRWNRPVRCSNQVDPNL